MKPVDATQDIVVRINATNWSHCVQLIYLSYYLKSADALSASLAGGGEIRKGIACSHLRLTSVHNLREFQRNSS